VRKDKKGKEEGKEARDGQVPHSTDGRHPGWRPERGEKRKKKKSGDSQEKGGQEEKKKKKKSNSSLLSPG